jgi:formylglycine-generating enzyme
MGLSSRVVWVSWLLGCNAASGDVEVAANETSVETSLAVDSTVESATDTTIVDSTSPIDATAAGCGTMVMIPAGAFLMGASSKDDPLSYPKERPQHTVTLSAFEIDRCEVTTADYRACVTAGKCTAPKTTEGCNFSIAGRDNHPINCVQWEQADAYCKFVGKRLPTEAEWEKAARGGDGRLYPWGNDPKPSCTHAWIDDNGGTIDGGESCGMNSTAPVGTKPLGASPYGVHDMLGNVWEWTADWYQLDYYAVSPPNDPKGPPSGTTKVYRGIGWWDVNDRMLRLTFRTDETLMYKRNNQGFRCAK